MFKKKFKNILILWLLSLVLFFGSSRALAQSEQIYVLSLSWQKIIKDFWSKIFPSSDDSYKEKYYELLQELAKLKLALNQVKETEIINNREKYLPRLIEAEVLKNDAYGYIYADKKIDTSGTIVLDKNWALVGKVNQVSKNYVVISSLNVPGIEFNVMNIDGKLIGLAKTISNSFIEINFVDPSIEVKLNDFILTYGNDSFPSGFVVGTVTKINKTQLGQQLIVKLAFNLDSGKVYFVK
jgi:hypothetical protein